MRVLHGGADLDEQFESLLHRQISIVAIHVNGFAIHMFHDQVRRAVFEFATVDESCYGRMIQGGQNMSFTVKAAAQSRMQDGMMQHLDGHGLLVLGVIPLASIHRAHAALAQNGHDAVGTHPRSEQPVLVSFQQGLRRTADEFSQRVVAVLVGYQQRLHGIAQLEVISAGACQASRALSGIGVGDFLE